MQASFGAELEIEQRLERFAQVRLSPTPASVARMRARVMRETRLAISGGTLGSAPLSIDIDRRRGRHRRAIVRRGAGLGLAAALSVGAVGGVLAAGAAGGPLYDTRIWLETLTLPSAIDARTDAEIGRLEARMKEVLAAAVSGDSAAIQDALTAYGAITDEALTGAAGDAAALERIRAALDRHLAVLAGVADAVPGRASAALRANIERAIVHNNAVIDRVRNGSGNGNGGGPLGPTDSTPVDETPKSGKTPKPAATEAAAPVATPRPTPVATPDPTPDPMPVATPDPTPARTQQGPPSERPGMSPPAGGKGDKP